MNSLETFLESDYGTCPKCLSSIAVNNGGTFDKIVLCDDCGNRTVDFDIVTRKVRYLDKLYL